MCQTILTIPQCLWSSLLKEIVCMIASLRVNQIMFFSFCIKNSNSHGNWWAVSGKWVRHIAMLPAVDLEVFASLYLSISLSVQPHWICQKSAGRVAMEFWKKIHFRKFETELFLSDLLFCHIYHIFDVKRSLIKK